MEISNNQSYNIFYNDDSEKMAAKFPRREEMGILPLLSGNRIM